MNRFPETRTATQPEQQAKDQDEISAIKNVDWSISDKELEEFASSDNIHASYC